jgi:hypothetical protein
MADDETLELDSACVGYIHGRWLCDTYLLGIG